MCALVLQKKLASEAKLDMCKADDRHFIMMVSDNRIYIVLHLFYNDDIGCH